MNTATHKVEALSPEAFASLARGSFPCAPRYGRAVLLFSDQGLPPSVGRVCALLRDLTLQALAFLDHALMLLPKGATFFRTHKHADTFSPHSYPKEGLAFIPRLKDGGFLLENDVMMTH